MRRLSLAVAVFCCCGCSHLAFLSTASSEDQSPFVRGPYVSKVTTESASLFVGTKAPVASLRLSYREADDDDEEQREIPGGQLVDHEIALRRLDPGTVYLYTITAGEESASGRFITAPKRTEPFRFAVYGDSRTEYRVHEQVADAITAENPQFVLHTGDLVGNGNDERDWPEEFFGPARAMLRNAAVFPAIGNHEGNAALFYRYFGLPQGKAYYSFTWGGARFFVVDTCSDFSPRGEQWKWLDAELGESTAAWKIVVQHHPGISSGPHGFNRKVNEYLRPLYEKHAVDIVFLGHDHIYERTKPIAGPGGHPVTYVITGGGGAPLYGVKHNRWDAVVLSANHHVVVDVLADSLRALVKKPDGEVIDEFVLHKVVFEEID